MDKTYPTLELIAGFYPHWDACYVTATTNGEHARGSFHAKGEAIDVGSGLGSDQQNAAIPKGMDRFQVLDGLAAFLYSSSTRITELIHTHISGHSGWYVKNGGRVSAKFYGAATVAAHENHVHFAIASLAVAKKFLYALVQDKLKIKKDGIFGPQTKAAVEAFQKAHGLTVDGVVGPKTVAAMRRS